MWAGIWALITIPWVQVELRREKSAWARNPVQGAEPYTDNTTDPTPLTRLASASDRLFAMIPFYKPGTMTGNRTKPAVCDATEDV